MKKLNRGFFAKILEVDLNAKTFKEKELPEEYFYKYVGGSGLGAKILFDETSSIAADLNAIDPANILMFMAGPFTGTMIPTSSRLAIVAKSPLGQWGESDVGGKMGYMLKKAGYDGVLFRHKSEEPVYLWIENNHVELRSAKKAWGLDCFATEYAVKNETSQDAVVASIGPAGEKGLKYASIIFDGVHARAAGRCGLGAVMGSKNLKAVAVSGSLIIDVYDHDMLGAKIKTLRKIIKQKGKNLSMFGTAGGVMANAQISDMPARNWTLGSWVSSAEKICGEVLSEKHLVRTYSCFTCVIGCGRVVKSRIDSPGGLHENVGGPEYETLGSLGSLCLNDDLESIMLANEICNRYGMDTISAGSAVAFAIEAFEAGYITTKDTGGLKLRWGDAGAIVKLLHLIGHNEGIGEILGRGLREAAAILGIKEAQMTVEVKGLELPMHDPRAFGSFGVAYATYPRGGCHRGGSHYLERRAFEEFGFPNVLDRHNDEDKGRGVAIMQDYMGLYNSLKLCQLISSMIEPSDVLELMNYVTGWDIDLKEMLKTGERASNLKKIYNMACGLDRKDDVLPARVLKPFNEGGSRGYVPEFEATLKDYYQHRGWNSSGVPGITKIKELGLEGEYNSLKIYKGKV